MFERFTHQARDVVVRSQQEARDLGHNFTGTEHILLGLLSEDGGSAAAVLSALGVTREAVRSEIGNLIGLSDREALRALGIDLDAVRRKVEQDFWPGAFERTGRPGRRTGHIPFTPRAKKVLELSLREALKLKHNYIGTEHILLGLVREGEGLALQVLGRLGVDPSSLRAGVYDELKRAQAS